LADAIEVAKRLGIEVPDSPSPTQEWILNVLRKKFSGKEFDQWYSDLEVKDHIQDIQEAKDEVEKGCNEDIRDLAKDDIPMLEKHLELAQEALSAAGGPPES
jgi:putative membrane protein